MCVNFSSFPTFMEFHVHVALPPSNISRLCKAALLVLLGDVALGLLTGTVSFMHQLPIMLTRAVPR